MNELGWLPAGCSKECYGFRGPPFPQKLHAAMDARHAVIQWTGDGRAISVDAEDYERNVMRVHPGLVEISSFANFRRQMREYGFDWSYHPETREFEFSHECFVRGRPDLLSSVLTRRKRRRKHGAAASRLQQQQQQQQQQRDVVVPRRQSVISYAGVPKREHDRTAPKVPNPHTQCTAKSLSELTDEEWWTCCAPAIMLGMTEGKVHQPDCPTYPAGPASHSDCKFTSPLFFYTDDPDTGHRPVANDLWKHRVVDFDQL